MATRTQLTKRISETKTNISSKRSQINSSRKRAKFRGVTIERQFQVGKLGVKPFRKRRKAERRIALGEVSLFGVDLLNLNNTLSIQEQDLRDFDLLGGGI